MAKKKKAITDADRAMGKRIAAARERLGVSVTDLGYAWGGSRQTVQFWERGENFPPAADLVRLCGLLHIDANGLLDVPAIVSPSERELAAARQALLNLAAAARDAEKETSPAHKAPRKSLRRGTR